MSTAIWSTTIRTGSWDGDQAELAKCQEHARGQGLAIRVARLPDGGYAVDAIQGFAGTRIDVAGPVTLAAHGAAGGPCCELCGRAAPTHQVTLMQNVGLVVLRFPKTIRGQLCRACIDANFWPMTLITFFFGWWGVISFFHSLLAIPLNIVSFASSRHLPKPDGP